MPKIAIICCDNGLGHTRRGILQAKGLVDAGFEVDLFAPTSSFNKVLSSRNRPKNIKNIDFDTGIGSYLRHGDLNLLNDLLRNPPNLDSYEKVISDNLICVLQSRPDTIISANFFWHEIEQSPNCLKSVETKLLRKFRPKIFGSALFSSEAVKKQPGFHPIGMIQDKKKRNTGLHDNIPRDSILLSIGNSGLARREYLNFFSPLMNLLEKQFTSIYIDPNLSELREYKSTKIIFADYSKEMYQRLLFAIIRPGMGTLTELMQNSVVPICIYEQNFELSHNASVIGCNMMGADLGNLMPATKEHFDMLEATWDNYEYFKYNASSLSFSGVEEFILNIIVN